ncbi:sensor histidine kinase [Mariniflexile ostreae]|uniref:histidine kinase n=1 Tax=Mariniflexile ostreae TaxID=1520892 RepID=A0ABV5FDL8_9FLAO
MISLFLLFQKKKNTLLFEQEHIKKRFEQELSKAQIEIREETFRNISWELHDNIGQLLTLAKIQLQNHLGIEDVKQTLNKSLQELRILSKSINPDALKNISLEQAIGEEIGRFNRLNFIISSFTVNGQVVPLDTNIKIMLFRMVQEFFSNTIKHAKATHLDVLVHYKTDSLIIEAKDDGQGFNVNAPSNSGIGLINIKNRAKLIHADAVILSDLHKGTKLTIIYKFNL